MFEHYRLSPYELSRVADVLNAIGRNHRSVYSGPPADRVCNSSSVRVEGTAHSYTPSGSSPLTGSSNT